MSEQKPKSKVIQGLLKSAETSSAQFTFNVHQFTSLSLLVSSVNQPEQLCKKDYAWDLLRSKFSTSQCHQKLEAFLTLEDIRVLVDLFTNLLPAIDFYDHEKVRVYLEYFAFFRHYGSVEPMYQVFAQLLQNNELDMNVYMLKDLK